MADGPPEEDAFGWKLGRYTLHGEIAAGGMATVHIGRMVASAGFTKMVAIKRLHEQFAGDPDFVAMFLDEARLAARVHHPNVVQPLDVIATDGEVFLVMEYVRGESLARIQRILRPLRRRVPLKIAGAIMVGVLHGLHAAHEATNERGAPLGIVHRDVSPQNVLVGTDGIARVLDFGVAKAADRAHCTREGDLKGKLAYMSPEQLAGAGVDRRTDIFAAAVVLWEILTGQRLYEADYQSAIAARTRGENPRAPSEIAPEVPQKVDALVKKGLARDPAQRFATAREMAIALEMAMPLATPSKVGEWVEEIASDSLVKRAARIAEIEQERSPESSREQAHALLHELRISRAQQARRVPAPRSSGDLRTMGREATTAVEAIEASAILLEPQTISEVHRRETPTPAVPTPPAADLEQARSGERESDTAATEPRIASSQMLEEAPTLDDLPSPDPPTVPRAALYVEWRKLGAPVLTALLLAVIALLGLFLLLPTFVKRSYVRAAAKHGIVLAAHDIALSRHRVRLVGCALTFPDLPGVHVQARALDFDTDGNALSILEPEIVVDGAYAPVRDSVVRYFDLHPLKEAGADRAIERIAVIGARLRWMHALGERSLLDLSDIHGEMVRAADRELGQDYAFEADRITLSTSSASIGPWKGNLTQAGESIVANVTLSQDSSQPATATYMIVTDPQGFATRTLKVEIPRLNAEQIGFPKGMLGPRGASPEVEGTLLASRSTLGRGQEKLEVEGAFALYGVNLEGNASSSPHPFPPPSGEGFDVRFQGRLQGNPDHVVEIDGGVMTFGSFRARLWGEGTFSRDGFRVHGAWSSAPRACELPVNRNADISIPDLAADPEALYRAVTRTMVTPFRSMNGVFAFDSGEIEQTRATANLESLCER